MAANKTTTIRRKFSATKGVAGKTASIASIILKGHGQIMLQENRVTGLLFLIGIFYGSPIMGFAVFLATVCGTITAFLLNYNKAEIDKGLYGFGAALVGVAVLLFLKPVIWSWVFIVLGSALAAVVQHFFIKRKIPVFTLPFVLVTWLILFISSRYNPDLLLESTPVISPTSDYLMYGFKSYGQVIFQSNWVSGLLFFIAVFISSPIAALYGLLGGILSSIIAFKFSAPIHEVSIGLYGYNAVLCAILFAGNRLKDGIWFLISVLLSLCISSLMVKFGMVQLTFPFVLASWITLVLIKKLDLRSR